MTMVHEKGRDKKPNLNRLSGRRFIGFPCFRFEKEKAELFIPIFIEKDIH